MARKKPREKINREYVWDHPNIYNSRTCSICRHRIKKISDMEFDHTHAHSKGGVNIRPAHWDCNRIKGNKGLAHIQSKMDLIKPKTRSRKKQSHIFDSLNFKDMIPNIPKFKI